MKIESLNKLVPDPKLNSIEKTLSNSKNIRDSADLSDTAKVLNKVDNFLNLGKTNRFDLSDMSEEDKKSFIKIMASLIQNGIVGYEEFEVKGRIEKHYLANQIGNERLYGAKPKNIRSKT